MTVTVSTAKLIDVLTDALQTADYRVHLASHRGPWRDEPGNVDLLAFTSTTGHLVGHTWIPVDGQLAASVWPADSAATVTAICKGLLSRRGKEHTVDIDMVKAEPAPDSTTDEHPGWVVTMSETPALFPSDTEFQFHADPDDKFPIRAIRRILQPMGEVDQDEPITSALTLWSPTVLKPLVAVAKRRNMSLQFFRSLYRRTQTVQIGDTWLGAAIPGTPLPGEHGAEPSIEPVLAELVGAE